MHIDTARDPDGDGVVYVHLDVGDLVMPVAEQRQVGPVRAMVERYGSVVADWRASELDVEFEPDGWCWVGFAALLGSDLDDPGEVAFYGGMVMLEPGCDYTVIDQPAGD